MLHIAQSVKRYKTFCLYRKAILLKCKYLRGKLMKMKRLSFLLALPLLISCSNGANATLEDYISKITKSTDEFVVCTLSDIHLSSLSTVDEELAYLEKCVYSKGKLEATNEKPDLIVLDGDVFMDTNKKVVDRFFSWIDSLNIPFAYTYGNHDLQNEYSNTYIDRKLKACKNSVLKNPIDNVYGDANYVVNMNKGNETLWQVYVFDSNTYYGFDYDVVHDDQIKWFADEADLAGNIPNIAFMHVPFEEFEEAWNELCDGKQGGGLDKNGNAYYMGEGVSNGYRENDLYETMQKHNTKGVICGHDHINNTDWHYNKNGNGEIRLIYTEKSGRGIYHDTRMMGAMFVTLQSDGEFDLLRTSVKYATDTVEEISSEMLASFPWMKA